MKWDYTIDEFVQFRPEQEREEDRAKIELLGEVARRTGINTIGCNEKAGIELHHRDDICNECFSCIAGWIWVDAENNVSLRDVFNHKKYIFDEYNKKYIKEEKPHALYKGTVSSMTLADYLQDPDAKWLVDHTLSKHFPKHTVALFEKIKNENIPLRISLNTILNKANYTKADVITQRGKYKMPKSIEKYPFVYGILVREASKVFSEDALARFYDFAKVKEVCEQIKEHSPSFRSLLNYGCKTVFWPNIDIHVVSEYLGNCKDGKKTANEKIKSEETMLRYISDIIVNTDNPTEMDVAKVYRNLVAKLEGKYHLLTTNEEMMAESKLQHNCVRTYIRAVNQHECGIFNCEVDGKHYTIEVNFKKGEGYSCKQFLGFANKTDESCKQQKKIFNKVLKDLNYQAIQNKEQRKKKIIELNNEMKATKRSA